MKSFISEDDIGQAICIRQSVILNQQKRKMSKLNFRIFFIFFIFLKANILCEEEPIKISINFSDEFELNKDNSFNKYFNLEYKEEDLEKGDILFISSNSDNYLTPGYIYASFEEKKPTPDSRQFSSQLLGKNNLYINISKLKKYKNLYINIHSLEETKISFNVSLSKEITISQEEKKINFKLSDISHVHFSPKDISSNKILFYGLGENINYFKMNVKYILEDKTNKEFPGEQKYENGYGVIIDLSELDNLEEGKFNISLEKNGEYEEKKYEVGFDFVDEADYNIIDIDILDHIYGAAKEGENCYKIKNLDISKNATILFNSFTQDISFTLKKNETKLYSLDIFNNYFIKFPNDLINEENYFCFKKFTPKEKEEEILGTISYDFQIYYEEELSNIQSYIMPLINGKVYTHSLNSGDIFIYRHNYFSNLSEDKKIYSANLLTIRGKPKMYGYSCKTYPDCNLDEKKFNELKEKGELDIIKPFNQYSINKKENALGNIEIDKNGESVSELREQYLTIIKCETPDDYPNYGECKYAIEINNELDIIQLAPEIVFKTSIISNENNYLIKIADYKNIEYLKVTFTVLTGNAEIFLFSEDEKEIDKKKYNFRNVHRKEVFEFKDKDNIEEKYYIKIISKEPSFIELKYETDFYFRGYTMMNPNEINIEYVNKQNGFMPLEIQNPDYLYPITDPRNNDFYFTIKSLDCGMTYRYNFQDDINITSRHHEVKKDDINFGTSYAFMLKVEDYFHTIKDETEDCAMIIYTGEKSENTPLLMISDMPHPSNFSENYYIYPFIYNEDFNGIFVDIKFDYESLEKLEKSPLVEVSFKIGDQEKDFQKYRIKKDYTFFIKNEDAKKYCSKNLQCSLTIGIKKIYGEKEKIIPYIIKTNVYNAKKSPQYIFKNKVYNYKILPNGSKYFYTQIDSNEEGEINFSFNRGNSKIFAKIVKKDEIEENNDWNGRVKLPEKEDNNLLNYDPIYGIIKYTKKDTEKCEKGCELYIQIKSEEKIEKETEFTDVSFSINQKSVNNIKLRLNEYIKGKLEKDGYKYYNIFIPEDYLKISINLYSPYGKAKIKYNHIQTNDEEYNWELIPKNSFGRIIIDCKDKIINKETLKGSSFTIAIINNENFPEDNIYYYLEIQGLYNNDKPYYDLTSERSIICNTEKENYCHVLVYLNHYYNNKNNLVSALPLSNSNNIKIYAKYNTSDYIDKKEFRDSIQDFFPINEKNGQNSNGDKFLLLDSSKINDKIDNYVFLTFDCGEKNSLLKIVLSGSDMSQILLPYNTEKLFVLNKNKKEFFLLNQEDNNYILNIKSLKGISTLDINSVKYDIKGNHYIEIKPKEEEPLEINSNEQSILILYYEKMNNKKIYEIIDNNNTEILFPISGEHFPIYTYIKLYNNSNKEITISFTNIEYKEKVNDNKDLFDINAYIIKEELLNNLIINPGIEIKENKIEVKYNEKEKKGEIKSEQIKNNDNYLFMKINKNNENKNKYKKIKTEFKVNDIEDKDKDKDDDKGNGWIIIFIIIAIVCVILLIILFIFKKKRLSNIQKTEEEVNKINMPLNEKNDN